MKINQLLRKLAIQSVKLVGPKYRKDLMNLESHLANEELKKKNQIVKEISERLDLHSFVASEISNVPILYLEFGVFEGKVINFWSKLNRHEDSKFIGFDSFEGLPEKWYIHEKGFFDVQGKIPQTNDKRVTFVKGIFQAVLIDFVQEKNHLFEEVDQVIIHIDADLYSSSLFCLSQLYPCMPEGTIIIFDDFGTPLYEEFKAFMDWAKAHLISYEVIAQQQDWTRVAFRILRKRKDYMIE